MTPSPGARPEEDLPEDSVCADQARLHGFLWLSPGGTRQGPKIRCIHRLLWCVFSADICVAAVAASWCWVGVVPTWEDFG